MNNKTPLNARIAWKEGAKNDANVNATRERLPGSIDFSAYSFCWYSFIFMFLVKIPFNLFFVKAKNNFRLTLPSLSKVSS